MKKDEGEHYLEDDYRRRRVRIPPPKAMGDVMSQLLARRGYAQVQTAAACTAAWRTAVGEKIAASTRAGAVRRGVLEVLVSNSAVMQELAFMKVQLIRRLKDEAPDQQIRDIRFRVGPID